jgi:hypothetical protein
MKAHMVVRCSVCGAEACGPDRETVDGSVSADVEDVAELYLSIEHLPDCPKRREPEAKP